MRGKQWSCDIKRSIATMHTYRLDKQKIALYAGLSTVERLLAKINKGFVVPTHKLIQLKQQRTRVLTEGYIVVC